MSPTTPLSPFLRTEALMSRPAQPKAETAPIIAERTQALAKQLDEQLSNRLFAVRETVKSSNLSQLGSLVDVDA